MSFDPADIQIPEDLLADMIAETQTWRAMVAYPFARWESLKTTIAAGTTDLGDAASRIEHVYFDETVPDNPARPRCVIRQFDDETSVRDGAFSLNGSIVSLFELPVADELINLDGLAIKDARSKLFALKTELMGLPVEGGRLRIMQFVSELTGMNDPTTDGAGDADRFLVGVFAIHYDGGAC